MKFAMWDRVKIVDLDGQVATVADVFDVRGSVFYVVEYWLDGKLENACRASDGLKPIGKRKQGVARG